ncbi:PREDICTED: uncharacterized protein LOC109482271 [Branchiostoma belcheri]|uniref:Uncharacterized protein LOC109482271 n=1 Tax=Branchiostoma belcheri TaxID=7741 RepID=A0A6P4ZUG1_BRABE|nr:PREDICTED: uncharacterized protein LOC109482271 [Branchiostoma belcheri]
MTEMKDLHKLLLRRYHRQLVRDMQTTRVLVQMLAVFDQSEEAEVLAGQTPTDRATRFLKILPQKGPEAFEAFVNVLEKKQPELARPLREEGLRESASSKNGEKPTFLSPHLRNKLSSLADFTPSQWYRLVEKLPFEGEERKNLETQNGSYPVLRLIVACQNVPIRRVARAAREVDRDDVADTLRAHLPKGTTGPKLADTLPIKDLPRDVRLRLTTELNITRSAGKDWKLVAERIGVLPQTAQLWEHNKARTNPAEKLLSDWHKRPDATVGKLYQILVDCKMEDIADIL